MKQTAPHRHEFEHNDSSVADVLDCEGKPLAAPPVEEEIVMVTVNGREYPTRFYGSVQRFVPIESLKRMVDSQVIDLNQVVMDLYNGRISVEDYVDFYTRFGYSVSGFVDAVANRYEEFTGKDFEILNPLWEDDPEK